MSGDNVAISPSASWRRVNHRDLEAILEEVDSRGGVVRRPSRCCWEVEATVYRGHEGYRDLLRDLWDVFEEIQIKLSEIRDLWRPDRRDR